MTRTLAHTHTQTYIHQPFSHTQTIIHATPTHATQQHAPRSEASEYKIVTHTQTHKHAGDSNNAQHDDETRTPNLSGAVLFPDTQKSSYDTQLNSNHGEFAYSGLRLATHPQTQTHTHRSSPRSRPSPPNRTTSSIIIRPKRHRSPPVADRCPTPPHPRSTSPSSITPPTTPRPPPPRRPHRVHPPPRRRSPSRTSGSCSPNSTRPAAAMRASATSTSS